MDIDQMIKKLQDIRAIYGNLSLFHSLYGTIDEAVVEVAGPNFPDEWNMPETFVVID